MAAWIEHRHKILGGSMKKYFCMPVIAGILFLTFFAFTSCTGAYIDPSYADYMNNGGGDSGGGGDDGGGDGDGGSGGGGGDQTDLTYSASTGDYVIVIKKASSQTLSVATGAYLSQADSTGSYQLYYNGDLVSSGTAIIISQTITFTCSYGEGQTFSATINSVTISFTSTTIPTNNGRTITIPNVFSKQTGTGTNPFVGTWYDGEGGSVVITQFTWAYSNRYSNRYNNLGGTYTHIGNTAAYRGYNSKHLYVTTIINGVFHTQGLAFSK
jgi:hypothetical protein